MAEFVYNRTQRHVDRLKLLQRKGYANLSTSEREEYHGSAALGAYNYTDINRVETAVAEIAPLYGLHMTTVTDRTYWSVPVMAADAHGNMTRYLNNVATIRDVALAVDNTLEFPELPGSMNYMTWEMANNIEKTLHMAYENASLAAGHTLTWDGSVDGKLEVEGEWVKVSDEVPTIDDFAFGFALAYSDGHYLTFSPASISEHKGGISLDGHNVVIVYKAGAQIYDSAWPYTGTYFWYPEGLRSLTIPGYTGFRSDTISVTHDGQGNVTVTGITATEAGGNVTLFGVTAADDGNGNITVS